MKFKKYGQREANCTKVKALRQRLNDRRKADKIKSPRVLSAIAFLLGFVAGVLQDNEELAPAVAWVVRMYITKFFQ